MAVVFSKVISNRDNAFGIKSNAWEASDKTEIICPFSLLFWFGASESLLQIHRLLQISDRILAVIETLVKLCDNSKKTGKHSPEARVEHNTTFLVPPNFHSRLFLQLDRRSDSKIKIIIIILLTVKRSAQLIEPASYRLLQVPAQMNKIKTSLAHSETSSFQKSFLSLYCCT